MRTLRGIYVIWYREILRFLRDPSRIIGMFAQPLLYLLLIGNGISHAFSLNAAHGANYMSFMFPGIVGMSVLFTSIFGAVSIVWDREFGFLKEVFVSPLPRWAIAIGKAAGGSSVALIQGAVMLLLAPAVGLHLTIPTFLEMLGVLLLVSLALVALGIVIASRMSTMQGFQMVMNFIIMPLFFLSGALYPLRGMPGWLYTLMHIDPLTYGVDALRHIMYGISPLATLLTSFSMGLDLLVTVGVTAVLLVVAGVLFNGAKTA